MTTPDVRVSQHDPATVTVAGWLVFDHVAKALAAAGKVLQHGHHDTLDLSAVTRVDSAGVACVLAILAMARRSGGQLRVVHQPPDLVALARVCEVDAFLKP